MKDFFKKPLGIALLVLLVAGLGYRFWPGGMGGPGGMGRGPVPVIVAEVQETQWAEKIQSVGSLKAYEQVQLTSSAAGKVEEINFTDGQMVEKGIVLLRLESGEEKAELAAALALARETEKQYLRSKELRKQGATSQSVLDAHRREYETAKAQVGVAKARLEDRTIRAPFSGRIGLRQVSPGNFIQSGNMIATLTDNTPVRLDFSVPELKIAQLREGLGVEARTRAYPNKVFTGNISAIESFVNPVTRAVGVRALIPNEERQLVAGMLMNVEVQENPRSAVVLPEAAIVQESSASYVYVVKQGTTPPTAEKTKVSLGPRRPGEVEALGGLNKGDMVVIHGTLKLADGRPVNIVATKTPGKDISEILRSLRGGGKPEKKKKDKPEDEGLVEGLAEDLMENFEQTETQGENKAVNNAEDNAENNKTEGR